MLVKLINDWKSWSKTASKLENGWESDFPMWNEIISESVKILLSKTEGNEELALVDFIFSISTETQDLVDYSVDHFVEVKSNLIKLLEFCCSDSRWQIYEIFKVGDRETDIVLMNMIGNESDPYALRRGILTLLDRKPSNYQTIISKYANHENNYIKRIIKDFLQE